MKKIISSILSFIMIFNLATIAVYATEETGFKAGYSSTGSEATDADTATPAGQDTFQGHQSQYTQYENVDSASTEVYATRASTFTVRLPKTIILDGEDGTANYVIQLKGDVMDGDVISVEPSNTEIELNTAKGNRAPITATVSQDKTTVEGTEISEDWATLIEGAITAEQLKAGAWEGKLSFNINIKRETDREYIPFEITKANRAMIGYTDETTDLVIPATFQGDDGTWYKITSIGKYAFKDCNNLTSVIIPNSVISIGEQAFQSYGDRNLKSVIIPNSVISIGKQAFYSRMGLDITIPDSVIEIGDGAFWDVEHIEYYGTATDTSSNPYSHNRWGAKAIN